MFTFGFNVKPKKSGDVSYDTDASTFFTAASITDTTQKSAVNQLVLDLKSYNIWTKMKAIYPVVGGTAGSHAVNLKTPGTYNLTFSAGWTHSSTGMTPVNAFANTKISPSSVLSLNNTHLSYYSRTNANNTEIEIGTQSINSYLLIEIRTSNTTYFIVNTNTTGGASDIDSKGFYIANRTASNIINGFKNNSKIYNNTTASVSLPGNNIYLGALDNLNGNSQYYSSKECAFASIGDGLSDAEAANFYTAVQAYQTTLSRNV